MWGFVALLFGVFVWLIFHSQRPSLRVLMYHKVADTNPDFLTVTTVQLRQHLHHLQQAGYQFVSLPDVLCALSNNTGDRINPRAVLLTFDDAYKNNLTHALPVLDEFAVPAVIFVPTAFVGGTNEWDGGTDAIMTGDELKSLVNRGINLAFHSHQHLNYKNAPAQEVSNDLQANIRVADEISLPMTPALAYPYGGRPKNPEQRRALYETLERLGIRAAFRIGNRLNPLPLRNVYDLNRIDIRGTDSFATFKRKVKWGKIV